VLADLALLVGAAPASAPAEVRAERVIAWVFDLLSRLHDACDLPIRLSDVGVREADLPKIADLARNDGSLTYAPAETTREELLGLLRQAF
jgi:alcohol dehydrogenase class IV